ncbi:hypothetical protein P7C70_g6594, partial [Phenoliferia sp. Uapishka_3]
MSNRPLYWGKIEFTALSMTHEAGWLEEFGQMKPFIIIGKVHSFSLCGNLAAGTWHIELKQPTYVGKDFASNLDNLHQAFEANGEKATFSGGQHRIRLERDCTDYDVLKYFPEVFDSRANKSDDIGKKVRMHPNGIARGAIVACTAFARGWTYPGGQAGGRFELNGIRLLGNEHKNMFSTAPAPKLAIDI